MTPRGLHQSMRAVWVPRVNHPEQLLALNNRTITEKHELLAKCKDHFTTILNEMSTVEKYAVINIELWPTQHWMCKCPYLDEVSKVISMLCDGKSPGADILHPKVIKRGGRRLVKVPS